MTGFTNLTDASLEIDKPITRTIARAWRDNPVAIAEDDVTAPKILGVNAQSEVSVVSSNVVTFLGAFSASYDVYEVEVNFDISGPGRIEISTTNNNGATWSSIGVLYNGVVSEFNGVFRIFQPWRTGSKPVAGYFNVGNSAIAVLPLVSTAAINGVRINCWDTSLAVARNLTGTMRIRPIRKT